MALISGLIESLVRLKNQAWHTIPIWEEEATGNAFNAKCDAAGALIVSAGGGGAISVTAEGVVDDDAAVGTTKPLIAGGVYYSDPTADPIDDGDAGYILLNEQRMIVVSDRAFDPTSGANRNIPVWSPPDLWTPEDLSSSLGGDGTVTKYVVMEPNSRWSLQFIPNIVDGETQTLEIAQSNEDTGDVSTATYTDVGSVFFGAPGSFTTEKWIEPVGGTACLILRVQVSVSNYSSGTPSWSVFAFKRSNS
jgi:hypothetical protein